MQKFLLVQQAVFKQIKSEDEPRGHILPVFRSKADAATVVLWDYQHYLSAHCFENTTSYVNFDIQRTKSR